MQQTENIPDSCGEFRRTPEEANLEPTYLKWESASNLHYGVDHIPRTDAGTGTGDIFVPNGTKWTKQTIHVPKARTIRQRPVGNQQKSRRLTRVAYGTR